MSGEIQRLAIQSQQDFRGLSMQTSWSYADEKLSKAIRLLAVLPGDVRSRLLSTFMEFHTLNDADFPPELQRHYRWVMKQLEKCGPVFDHKGGVRRGAVEHTLSRIRNSTGAKIAERLLMLHDGIQETIRTNDARTSAADPSRTCLPTAPAIKRILDDK